MKNSQEVFDSHMMAVDTLSPSKVVEDYTEEAIFNFYKEFLPNFDGFRFNTIKQETHHNIVYFVWNGKNKHLDIQLATDTYIIDNGKIKQHTFAAVTN